MNRGGNPLSVIGSLSQTAPQTQKAEDDEAPVNIANSNLHAMHAESQCDAEVAALCKHRFIATRRRALGLDHL